MHFFNKNTNLPKLIYLVINFVYKQRFIFKLINYCEIGIISNDLITSSLKFDHVITSFHT